MLRVEDLVACYGQIAALKGVSPWVDRGEIVAIIGANGAGKTTLLSAISGLLLPRRGRLWLDGQEITGLPAERVVSLGIAHVPERRQVFASLSVEENLLLGAYHRLRHEPGRQIRSTMDEMMALFPALAERKRQLAGTLSGGQQQMLAIARGLMARPRLLLLDEPSLGLAPMVAREIFETIRALPERGAAVMLVEQNAHAALRLASRGYVLETGNVVLSGPAAELLSDPRVRGAYLGGRNRHAVPPGEPAPLEPPRLAPAG
ncbi:MAG: ABC transporter ATP-binding protein [Chloroflexi bacterium]|nr:ABC transporter ATP-binding protein [Chloroflexota bacterium]